MENSVSRPEIGARALSLRAGEAGIYPRFFGITVVGTIFPEAIRAA